MQDPWSLLVVDFSVEKYIIIESLFQNVSPGRGIFVNRGFAARKHTVLAKNRKSFRTGPLVRTNRVLQKF
jgi:hypothetical protein